MPDELAAVIARFKRRLDWARNELQRLSAIKLKKGGLDPEDKAHERRCEKVIGRLKGTHARPRGSAQGGPDDSETMGALAREGFLPGYGLESGSLIGTAEPPRMWSGMWVRCPRPIWSRTVIQVPEWERSSGRMGWRRNTTACFADRREFVISK